MLMWQLYRVLRFFFVFSLIMGCVSFAFCWAQITSAKGMSGTSKRTEEMRKELVGVDKG